MVLSKKIIVPEIENNEEIVVGNLFHFKINDRINRKPRKSIFKVSTYSYGSNGRAWYYLSKLNKKE